MPDSYSDSADRKEITRFPIDYWRNFGLSEQTSAMRLFRDKDGMLLAIPVTPFMSNASTGTVTNLMPTAIADSQPGTDGTNTFARAFGLPNSGIVDSTVGLVVNARKMYYDTFYATWHSQKADFHSRTTSAANAAQTVNLTSATMPLQPKSLDIYVKNSGAGTQTLDVLVSVDNTNFLTIDSIAGADPQIKHYDAAVVGGTIAISPMAFPFVRITVGTGGVGLTTTATVAMK